MSAAWRERWMRFWFEPASPTNLGVCRMLFFTATLWQYGPVDFSVWAAVSDAFWLPVPLFRDLHLAVAPAGVLQALQIVWKASLVLAAIGYRTRWSTAAAFVFGLYLLGLPQNFGKTHHMDTVVVITLGVLALARCGDGVSVDARQRQAEGPTPASGEYTWPIRFVWVLLALVFFGAGFSKVRHNGLTWILSDNMARIMAEQGTRWSEALARFTWICQLLAASAVVLEISAPLALVSRWARRLLVPGLFLMQVGIQVIMALKFKPFLVCYLFWVPWDRVRTWITAQRLRVSASARSGSAR